MKGQEDPAREHAAGTFVRRRRLSAGLTQQQLGERAGVGKRFVVELEGGKATLRLDKVNQVLAVFGKRIGVEDAPRPGAALGRREGGLPRAAGRTRRQPRGRVRLERSW